MKNQIELLNDHEKAAVEAFLASAAALPESICIALEDDDDEGPHLRVMKRLSPGHATRICGIDKPSLNF